MKKSVIIIGFCILLFGFSWHFVDILGAGTIFSLNEICIALSKAPPPYPTTPQWPSEISCSWIPFAMIGSYASTIGGAVLIIIGFMRQKKAVSIM